MLVLKAGSCSCEVLLMEAVLGALLIEERLFKLCVILESLVVKLVILELLLGRVVMLELLVGKFVIVKGFGVLLEFVLLKVLVVLKGLDVWLVLIGVAVSTRGWSSGAVRFVNTELS